MDRKKNKKELDVDFIGGEELTKKEEALLKDYFARKKKRQQKAFSTRKNKEKAK